MHRTFFCFVTITIHAFNGQTNRQTDSFLVTRPPCTECSAVKMLWVIPAVVGV